MEAARTDVRLRYSHEHSGQPGFRVFDILNSECRHKVPVASDVTANPGGSWDSSCSLTLKTAF